MQNCRRNKAAESQHLFMMQDKVTNSDAMLVTVFNMTQRKFLEDQLQQQQIVLQQ